MPEKTTRQKLPQIPWIGKRLFYGWVIVILSAAIQFAHGIFGQGFGTFLPLLQKEFGWSRALLASPRSLMQMQNSLLGPLEGWLMDRFGPRIMVSLGALFVGFGLILFSFTSSLWMYFLANIIIAIGSGLQGLLVLSVAVNNWFRRKRTTAQSLMLLGFPTAGIIGVPVLVLMQSTMGWQTSALWLGFLIWMVGLPSLILLRSTPEAFGLRQDGDTSENDPSRGTEVRHLTEEYDFTLREALRTRSFWFLSLGRAFNMAGIQAVMTHIFLHLQGVGLSPTTAAFIWSIASMVNIPSRLAGGFFGDRFPKYIILGAAIFMMAASQFILSLATSFQMAVAFAIIYGIGWGARTPVDNAIRGEYFGRKSQGVISGWSQTISLPFSVSAPIIAGYMADVQGDYRMAFILTAFVGLAGAILTFMAVPPKSPIRAEGSPDIG
ncbi:MAG: MFS transporter [Dehalococcoidales bacterium]|nr:MFS transporter [Dehalococcoidales bacterium]